MHLHELKMSELLLIIFFLLDRKKRYFLSFIHAQFIFQNLCGLYTLGLVTLSYNSSLRDFLHSGSHCIVIRLVAAQVCKLFSKCVCPCTAMLLHQLLSDSDRLEQITFRTSLMCSMVCCQLVYICRQTNVLTKFDSFEKSVGITVARKMKISFVEINNV